MADAINLYFILAVVGLAAGYAAALIIQYFVDEFRNGR